MECFRHSNQSDLQTISISNLGIDKNAGESDAITASKTSNRTQQNKLKTDYLEEAK